MNTRETPASRLRQLLREPGIIVAPGAYDCLTARIIQQAGFPAVYMTGAGTSVAALKLIAVNLKNPCDTRKEFFRSAF